MASITTTGAGNWSSTTPDAPWPSGTIPSDTDTVTIAHDVTNDYTPGGGADHCAGLTIDSGKTLTLAAGMKVGANAVSIAGTLAVGTYSFTHNGASNYLTASGSGRLTASPGAAITFKTTYPSFPICDLAGTPGSRIVLTWNGNAWGIGALGACTFEYCDFIATAPGEMRAPQRCRFTECDFDGWNTINNVTDCQFYSCFLYGSPGRGTNVITRSSFFNTVWGTNRASASDPNAGGDIADIASASLYGCSLTSSTEYAGSVTFLWAQGMEGAGNWIYKTNYGTVRRSTAAKKTGDYGIEVIPSSMCAKSALAYMDIPIPVNTGDTVAPSIYYQNVTADLDLEAAAGRLVFELDPGDEWGLNELIDASSLADPYNNWRQVVFTGGTAGGSSDKGTCILRVTLARYVASGVVYLADWAKV